MMVDKKEKAKRRLKKITLVIMGAVLAILAVLFFGTRIVTRNAYPRVDRPEFSYQWFYDHYEDTLPRKQVSIQSGENELAGFIYGEENDKGLVVLSHGSGAYHEFYMKEIVWFVQHGYRVFAADYTASGHSEGEQTGGLSKTPIDLDIILTYIEQDDSLNKLPKVLIGHSWGAYGVTAVLNYDHDIKAVVSLASYNEPAKQLADILGRTVSPILYGLEPFFRMNNIVDYGKYGTLTAVDGINQSGVPVMIVHGTGDQMIPYDGDALTAYRDKITNPNVEWVILTEEGHNDHGSFLMTKEAEELEKPFSEKIAELKKQYGDEIPHDELEQLYSNIDQELMNTPNEEFMQTFNNFFEKYIQ
ncbi:lysophospholipase [Streptococcus suis]|uniref:alpha/beta hydrolase n=1 Tax=Streptococcus suis TaxID=1307 RepID=UPI0003F9C2C7|nr:alpha/beta fold hydrolase [Streptococcus suis]QZT29744.1 lysophospholipase [Streptococcus suis]HEM3165385.1 alpha/beta fold hydrolase [Streptococcus suis 92-1191]HEM6182508.1 alpha/beta fold hydrolase [Streptococcus suis]